MRDGLVDQATKFKKRVASSDTSAYRVVRKGQLVVGFPIDEGVLSFQNHYDKAIVSPAYEVWDLTDPTTISSAYLERYLRSPRALSYYATKLQGSTARRRTLPRAVFLELPVPVRPLAEQRRIAAVLDHVDALRAKRREAIALLDDLTQSTLVDMFGDASRNPRGLPVVALRDLVVEGDSINYGVVQPGRDVGRGGVALIRAGDLDSSGIQKSSLMHIASDVEAKYKRSRLRGTEVLVGCVGAIGEVATATEADVGANVARAVARVPIASDVDREYLAAYLRTGFVQEYFRRELRTVAQPTLNIKQLKETPILWPSQVERARLVDRCRVTAKCRRAHLTHLAALDELFTSLQQRAFNGTLWQDQAA